MADKYKEYRNPDGTFKKGHPGGPGNPNMLKFQNHRRAIHEAVTPEDTKKVFRRILEEALTGDMVAAKLYLEYVAGKPKKQVDMNVTDNSQERYREILKAAVEAAEGV